MTATAYPSRRPLLAVAALLLVLVVGAPARANAASLVEARSHVFGAANVDQRTGAVRRDRVILSWFGVTNYAMAIRGHVVLLDAWVPRGLYSGVVPTTPEELAAIRPELIFIGHSHYDHAIDAVPIARASGATIVGTAEHCAFFASEAAGGPPVECRPLFPEGAAPGSLRTVPDLLRGVGIVAVKHLHSALTPPTELRPPVTPLPTDNVVTHPPTAEDLGTLVAHLRDPEGGSVLYRFAVGDWTLAWHNSSGPLVDKGPAIVGVLRSIAPVDVELGSIEGFNQITNGFRDPHTYIDALHPTVFVPGHNDDWQPGLTSHAAQVKPGFLAEYDLIPAGRRPELRYLEDPADYLRPGLLTFDVPVPRPSLRIRCDGRRHVRASLAGDRSDVTAVSFQRGEQRRTDRAQPWTRTLRRRVAGTRALVRAQVHLVDGTTIRLRRREPRCARTR